jgi:uncharacterized membrane protein YdbT with pleckstrin-like domain
MYFPSKKGIWMTIICWLLAGIFIVPPILFPNFGVFMLPSKIDTQLVKILITSVPALFILWIWFRTGYTINDSTLRIEYGPIKKTIILNEIKSIRKTKNPFIDLALSMDKIEINYGKFQTVSISPKNNVEFISQLLKRNSNIKNE